VPRLAGEIVANPVDKGVEVLHSKFGPASLGEDDAQIVVATGDIGVG